MSAMSLALRVAAEVRAESARRRVTGRELSRRTGVPISTLSRWTSGQTPIQLDDLDRIASALGADVVDLISAAKRQRPARPGTHLTPDRVGRILGRLLGPGWTGHTLRHRAASDWYDRSGDLMAVQDLLGHASPVTTRRYVRPSLRHLRRAVHGDAA